MLFRSTILIFMAAIFIAYSIINMGKNSGATGEKNMTRYTDIAPKAAKERLDLGEEITLLDVRTLQEYRDKHIPGSVLIPLDELRNKAPVKLNDKQKTIFVYCRSGNRSVSASRILIGLGYENVYNLGGIIDWPYDTE